MCPRVDVYFLHSIALFLFRCLHEERKLSERLYSLIWILTVSTWLSESVYVLTMNSSASPRRKPICKNYTRHQFLTVDERSAKRLYDSRSASAFQGLVFRETTETRENLLTNQYAIRFTCSPTLRTFSKNSSESAAPEIVTSKSPSAMLPALTLAVYAPVRRVQPLHKCVQKTGKYVSHIYIIQNK